jgi:hypothetical protein
VTPAGKEIFWERDLVQRNFPDEEQHYGRNSDGQLIIKGQDHLAAPVRGVAMLESQYPLEGARYARCHREHYPALRQEQGRVLDVGRPPEQSKLVLQIAVDHAKARGRSSRNAHHNC